MFYVVAEHTYWQLAVRSSFSPECINIGQRAPYSRKWPKIRRFLVEMASNSCLHTCASNCSNVLRRSGMYLLSVRSSFSPECINIGQLAPYSRKWKFRLRHVTANTYWICLHIAECRSTLSLANSLADNLRRTVGSDSNEEKAVSYFD